MTNPVEKKDPDEIDGVAVLVVIGCLIWAILFLAGMASMAKDM